MVIAKPPGLQVGTGLGPRFMHGLPNHPLLRSDEGLLLQNTRHSIGVSTDDAKGESEGPLLKASSSTLATFSFWDP